jgi:hypothetical protein
MEKGRGIRPSELHIQVTVIQRVMYEPKLYETLVKQSIVCHTGGRKLQNRWINCCNT